MSAELMNVMIMLFGLMAVGYISNRCAILDEAANARFSAFILKVTLPSTILKSAVSQSGLERSMVLHALTIAVGIFVLLPLMSRIVAKLFHLDVTYQLMLMYSNLGFMGLPIISSMYGEESVFYVVIFMMVFNVHIFTVGIMTLQGKTENLRVLLKNLCTPGIISSAAAFVIVMLGLRVPDVVEGILGNLGAITTPLAMVIIGSQLAQADLKEILKNRSLYLMICFKLVVYPAVIYLILCTAVGTGLVTDIATILVGLPVAANVTMLCSGYGGDTALAAEGTGLSTLLSLVTVPIMMILLKLY